MHEKKKLKSYGGITRKYHREMAVISYGSMSLKITIAKVLHEIQQGDSDHGEIQSSWLNGPYLLLPQFEGLVADLESKVNDDSEIPDKSKQEFMHDIIESIKDSIRKAHELDAYIMNGTVPPSMEL